MRKLKPKEESKEKTEVESNENNQEEEKIPQSETRNSGFIRQYTEEDQTLYDLDMTDFLNYEEGDASEDSEDDYVEEMSSICEIEQKMADNSELEKIFGDLTNSPNKENEKKKKNKKEKKKKNKKDKKSKKERKEKEKFDVSLFNPEFLTPI